MSDIPADLAAALSGRFELRQVLGRGGMATVYLATDRKHHREVAVKVLLPGLAAFLGTERFLTEIQIAARLNHPHILTLHDSGEADGFLYYVMPYVEGGSLRQRIMPAGRPSLAQALEILKPVADALSYAHRMGVLHRDIKPENILFSQGHPIVADFGIARAVTSAGGAHLTRTGFPIGTPGYMSPEQAAGLTDLDARADVYSLAVVSYELLVGELPGRWPTEEAVRVGRFADPPPLHRSRLTALGSPTESALIRGLSVRSDQRTATPSALIAELGGEAPRRRFSEGEVQEIVKRATEIEATNPTESGAMTIGGVEALAAEVGIEPALVRKAAGAMSRSSTPATPGALEISPTNHVIGGPTRLFIEREVEGELPDSEFPTLVEEIRRMLSDVGQVSQLGHSFSWISSRGSKWRSQDLEVSLSVRNGRTRIRAREDLSALIGATFGGIGGGMGGGGMGPLMGVMAGALHLQALAFVIVIPTWLGITYLTARTVYKRSVAKRIAGIGPLVERLAELTRELVPNRPRLEA
ncbi:MAG TPA: serine/threonine-protein kinase [Gemmatimonadales bacterium]|jgi:serine/threonine protein kinase|nr:serine/threonine-protein kinase [Gemmatimonadales bacterium]